MNDESLVKRATNGLKVQGSMFIQSRMQSQVCPHPALLYCSISTPSTARNEYLGCVGCCWLLRWLVTQFSEPAGFLVNKSTAWSCQPCLCGWWEVIGPWIAMIGCWKWRLVINADTQKLCTISYLFCCCDLVLIQYSLDTDRNCHTGYTSLGFSVLCLVPSLWSKVSLPNDLSEFRESEPIGICKNINSIHDQGRGHRYLEDRRQALETRISSNPEEDDLNH